MRKIILFSVFTCFAVILKAQCWTVQPKIYNLPCGVNCTNFSFQVPELRSTDNYALQTIPYTPYAYLAGGAEDLDLYDDDTYSNTIDLPFKFCFYDSVFNKIVVGSNGIVTFDYATNGSGTCGNSYNIGQPIPYALGTSCSIGTAYIPRASIMGCYTDLDPRPEAVGTISANPSPPDRKIEWRVEGIAPCRKFIISYYKIGTYGQGTYSATGTNCNSLNPHTFQMVIYESTGFIDIFIKNKQCYATSTNGNKAILGIQDWSRTRALAAPGKNATLWQSTDEGYRFRPNGTSSMLQNVIITKKDGTPVGNGTIGATANDSTNITFNNYCVSGSGPDTLVVKANYTGCDVNNPLQLVDTLYVVKNPGDLLATATTTLATCTASNGSLTVTVPAGAGTPPYQYSINGGPLQSSNIFSGLPVGTYTVFVKDAGGTCTSSFPVNIGLTNPVTINTVSTLTSCPGVSNGTITVSTTNGTNPVQYSINNGPYQLSNIFTGLAAGSYSIKILDGNGCQTLTLANVTDGTGITATVTQTPTTCAGVNNGIITITNPTGTGPHQYALDAGAFQTGNVFSGVSQGLHTVKVKDASGCIFTTNITVAAGAGISATVTQTPTTCSGINNGVITITNPTGTAPHQYALDAGAFQAGNSFTGVSQGIHTVKVKDANGCLYTTTITVTAGTGITATVNQTPASCAGINNGVITITNPTGTGPHDYALDAGAFQPVNNFSGVAAGLHTVKVRDANGCIFTTTITVGSGTGVAATSTVTNTTCAGINNGSITISTTTGLAPFQYSINAAPNQTSNIFNNLAAGTYAVVVTDAAGCFATLTITVGAGTVFSLNQSSTAATCTGSLTGSITVTPTGGVSPFSFVLDAGTPQLTGNFNNVASGPHTVAVTDANGCSNSIVVTVAVGAGISATAVANPTSCNGAVNGSITISPAAGVAPYQYQLNAGSFQASNLFSGIAAGTYTITVKDFYNCTTSIPVTVAQGANLSGTTAVTNVLCNGANTGSVTITNTNGNPPYQYSINGAPFQGSATFNNLTAGTYSIALKDGNNCTGSISVTITEPVLLNVSVSNTAVTCNGQNNGMITVTGSGGNGGYSYSLDGILYQSGNTFSVTAGNYTVYLKDANGCIKTATAVVNQPPVVTLNATATNASCNGGADGVITANAGGGVLPYTYSIDGINFQNGNTFNVLPGNFTVTVKDGNNCSKTFNVTVGLTSNILVSTRTDTAICESKSVQLTTNSNATSFLWSPATALNDPTLKSPVASPVTTTQYIVTATLGNCSKNDTILITVNQAPVPDAGLGTTICFGKNYTLNGTGGVQFLWSPASSLSNPNIASPVATPVSTTTYSLSVTDALGCSSLVIDTVTVAITPPIIVSAGPDTTIVTGQPYQLNTFITNPTMALNMYNYLWSPAFGLSNGNISNPVAIISTQQLYSVEVTTPEGCKGNASVLLKVFLGPDIYVPTGFTPNGDGKNDILKITVVGIRQFDFFRIYNRFGQMVFETKDPAVGWEGRFRFANQPTGAYIFNVQGITDKGMLIRKKGTIILAR